jgi:hypothetical protein
MFTRIKRYYQLRKEVDRTMLRRQAVEWTKQYFKQRGVPTWTHEYQYTFATHVEEYMKSYLHSYAKVRLNQER